MPNARFHTLRSPLVDGNAQARAVTQFLCVAAEWIATRLAPVGAGAAAAPLELPVALAETLALLFDGAQPFYAVVGNGGDDGAGGGAGGRGGPMHAEAVIYAHPLLQ